MKKIPLVLISSGLFFNVYGQHLVVNEGWETSRYQSETDVRENAVTLRNYSRNIIKVHKQASEDFKYSLLSSSAYYNDYNAYDNFELIDSESFSDGLDLSLYREKISNELILAFRGTEFKDSFIKDFISTDVPNVIFSSSQQNTAKRYVKKLVDKYGRDITVTGHSLGGSLAQISAARYGLKAVTFDTASVSHLAKIDNQISKVISNDFNNNHEIRNYIISGDEVNNASKLWGLSGGDYGKNIYIYTDNSFILDKMTPHKIDFIINEMQKMAQHYHSVLSYLDPSHTNFKNTKVRKRIQDYIFRQTGVLLDDYDLYGTFIDNEKPLDYIIGEALNNTKKHNHRNLTVTDEQLFSIMTLLSDVEIRNIIKENSSDSALGILDFCSSKTQSLTSHFGTPDGHMYQHNPSDAAHRNSLLRETAQENPYLESGSVIIEAPADIVLAWGSTPADLDSHLTGPMNSTGSERFHTSFRDKGSLDNQPNVMLYTDNTRHSVGGENSPEQTRINVTQPGKYNFYVHDFSNRTETNSTAMSNSGAVVSVHTAGSSNLPEGNNLGEKVAEYNVPTNQVGTAWHTFELDTVRNTIKPVNEFQDVENPDNVPFND